MPRGALAQQPGLFPGLFGRLGHASDVRPYGADAGRGLDDVAHDLMRRCATLVQSRCIGGLGVHHGASLKQPVAADPKGADPYGQAAEQSNPGSG